MEYLLLTDETNITPTISGQFFIYGGLILPVSRLKSLSQEIENIRRQYRLADEAELKFDTNSRPRHITPAQHRDIKNAVIDVCVRSEARFVAYVVLHELARSRSRDNLVYWGVNSVLCAFERFLQPTDSSGICILDRVPSQSNFQFLKEKFQNGLQFPSGQFIKLQHVEAYAYSCIGASHASSATDIVLGAFRFCVNERIRMQVVQGILPRIAGMMWHKSEGGRITVREYGLLIRPRDVRSERLRRNDQRQ
jgi:hypothetical protein